MKLITYSIDKDTDSSAITKLIKSQESCACLSENTWLVDSVLTYLQFRDMLLKYKPHSLIVIPFEYGTWTSYGCSKEINEFLIKNTDC